MAATTALKLRLLRDDPRPPNAANDESPCAFGLQDNKGQLHDVVPRDDGMLAVEFELRVAASLDEARPPIFLGPFVFGKPDDRFVYLSWQRAGAPGYVNRIKARLADIDWAMVHEAQDSGGRLEADLSGRKAGGGKVPVAWRIVDIPEPEPDEPAV